MFNGSFTSIQKICINRMLITVGLFMLKLSYCCRCRLLEEHPLQVRHKQDWSRGFIPRLLHFPDQMLEVMLFSQHRVSSSKTVGPRAPCGARCIGQAVGTWSAVCSKAPHSQFGEGGRPHLCMDEWNRPTPVRRRLSLTQAARGKLIPTSLAPVLGTKHGTWKHFKVLRIPFMICPLKNADAKSSKVYQKIPPGWHKWASRS